MANESLAKPGMEDLVASATEGVLRAMEARRVSLDGASVKDLVQSGFNVEIVIRAGGLLPSSKGIMPGGTISTHEIAGQA